MKTYLKKILIIFMIIAVLFGGAPVHANKVNKAEFYYGGTVEGSYTTSKSFLDFSITSFLGKMLDYLLGIITMGIRMVFVGWTALVEWLLTSLFKATTDEESVMPGSTELNTQSSDNITIESIVYNRVPIFDVNIFKFDYDRRYTATGQLKEIDN